MVTPGASHTPLMATFYRILPGTVKLFWGAVLVGDGSVGYNHKSSLEVLETVESACE
jgi:hypothetical protein